MAGSIVMLIGAFILILFAVGIVIFLYILMAGITIGWAGALVQGIWQGIKGIRQRAKVKALAAKVNKAQASGARIYRVDNSVISIECRGGRGDYIRFLTPIEDIHGETWDKLDKLIKTIASTEEKDE
jgi:hypothetical protein